MRRLVIGVTLLVAASFGYTLFTENFDAASWTPNNPPAGWRIYHSDPLNQGDDDWHRDSGRSPWAGHPTPFAAILYSATLDSTPDSLISPVIDCRGYGRVVLRCSTDFEAMTPLIYTAQIVYSTDSGQTFPYVLRDYYDEFTGTICESLPLPAAQNKAGVVIAWAFTGRLMGMESWYLDDIVVTGESLAQYSLPFTENFDAASWTPNYPPGWWRIYHGDPLNEGNDDWHRDSGRSPWNGHPTPFAAILPSTMPDTTPDSLVSPVIDCRGYKQVTLRCSTSFTPVQPTPYTASLAYSIDSGATFPYVLKTYAALSGTICESLVLDQAQDQAGVAIAWVFDGTIDSIVSWFVDDVELTGVSLYRGDVQAGPIVSPAGAIIETGPLSPACRFRNLGDSISRAIPVACSLYDNLGNGLAGWTGSIDSLWPGWPETVAVFAPSYNLSEGDYSIKFWCSAGADTNQTNDTVAMNFTASNRWDVRAGPIVEPGAAVFRSGPLTPACRFRNLGDSIQRAIPVACSLYDNLGNGLAGWTGSIDSLWAGWPETVAVFSPAFALTAGDYAIRFWCAADSDYNRLNDTVQMNFHVVDLYDMATTAIVSPLDTVWPGALVPSARFANLGDTVQTIVPVACTLYDNAMNVINTWLTVIGPVQPSADTLVAFAPPYSVAAGDYYVKFTCTADSDYNRGNDTLAKNFTAWRPAGVLFEEYFDTLWSTNNPPPGWRIFHTSPGDSGRDDWHRELANTSPWIDHPTPFAAIGPIMSPDAPPDSLISPIINCAGYRNITLYCSTYFYRWSNQPYTAKLMYSTDGGLTWPFTLHDYYMGSSPGPVRESLALDSADGKANVQLGWVFDGEISRIQWWSLDDIIVTGTPAPAWDVACRIIVSPKAKVPPGPLQPVARFRNRGDSIQYNVPVACSLYDNAMNGLAGWTDVIDTILPQTGEKVKFFSPAYNLALGQYFIKFWCAADSDQNRANDTLSMSFEASLQNELSYDDGTPVEYKSWPVGHCGWGVKFDADTFPVFLESLKVYLDAPTNPAYCGYQLAVFRDDGSGTPATLYFKTPVQYATPGTAGWNSVFLADTGEQLVMPDGQFYVFYLQVGEPPECPGLGRDAARNPLASYWQYRKGVMIPDSTPGDFMIRAVTNMGQVVPATFDLRARYVDQPLYEFVQRPFDAPITPKGVVENFGSMLVTPVSVECDIIGPTGTPYYANVVTLDSLPAGKDTLVTFANWVPATAERCSVVLSVYNPLSPTDSVPQNDVKRFTVDVLKGAHTGSSPLQYAWIDSDTTGGPTYAWIDTNGFNILPNLDDNGIINVPFPAGMHFPYYDSTYDFVLVSANGWVALGSSNPGGDVDTIPNKLPIDSAPNRCIYAWWDNLAQGPRFGGGYVFYRSFGVEPNRYMVLVFQDVNRVGADTANGITFELIFRENGTIVCQYKDVETGDLNFDNAKNASIGIENIDGTDGLNYLYARPPMSSAVNDLANRVSSGRAIYFQPVKRDAAALTIVKPGSYEFPGLITPVARIQNYGTVSDSIRVFMNIGLAYAHDTLIAGIIPGDSIDVSFESFSPWDAQLGTYTAVCSVRMVGDVDSSNNVTSKFITVSTWVRRADIPPQWRKRKVRNAALTYASTTGRLYALKGQTSVDFWTYNPATDSWDTLANLPLAPSGSKPRDGCHLTFDSIHGNLGSIWAIKGGGRPDFYRYDIESDTWYAETSAIVTYKNLKPPDVRTYRPPKKGAAIEFVPNQGSEGAIFAIPGNRTNYIWYYDIGGDSWTYPHDTTTENGQFYMTPWDIPSGPDGKRCKYGSDLAYLNGKLYVLKGSGTVEAYEFTPGLTPRVNPWDSLDRQSFELPRYRRVRAGGSLVANGNMLYALKGGNTQEFYRYDFTDTAWHKRSDIPLALTGRRVKVKRQSAMASVDSTIYCLKGSNCYEFWQYKPSSDSASTLFGPLPNREGVMADVTKLDLSMPWLRAYPNPTRSGLTVSYNVTSTAPTRLRVYDASGRFVVSLWDGERARGRYVTRWNALAVNGKRVPAGVYFLKLQSGDTRLDQKFIIQR